MKMGEILKEYYDMSDDNHQITTKGDTRRPRLTLLHLNRLKKIRELRKLESGKRAASIPKIYHQPPQQ